MNLGNFFNSFMSNSGDLLDALMEQCWRVERLACEQENKGKMYTPEIRTVAKADNLQTLEILVDQIDKEFESADCTISMVIAVAQCGCVFGGLWESTHQKICELHTELLDSDRTKERIKALYEDALVDKLPDYVPVEWKEARDQRQADKDAKSLLRFMDEETE